MTTRRAAADAVQARAIEVVNHVTNALRVMGWDFVTVSISRAMPLDDGTVTVPGSSTFAADRHIMPALPSLADNLRVIARQIDASYAASGCTTRAEGYTHVLDSSAVRRKRPS